MRTDTEIRQSVLAYLTAQCEAEIAGEDPGGLMEAVGSMISVRPDVIHPLEGLSPETGKAVSLAVNAAVNIVTDQIMDQALVATGFALDLFLTFAHGVAQMWPGEIDIRQYLREVALAVALSDERADPRP